MQFQKKLGPIVTSILDSWETTISTVYECEWQPAQMLRRHKLEHTMGLAILLCIPITTWLPPHITFVLLEFHKICVLPEKKNKEKDDIKAKVNMIK